MADKSLSVDTTFQLNPGGWQFLSYNTVTGFLIRDARQGKPRLEILYWKRDRDQDDTQFVLDAESGNVGIGAANPTDKLTIRGGALSFQRAGQAVSEMGIDYDDASQSLRIRERTGEATALNADVLTITRSGTVKATAFEGSGARITGINAANITTGTLAVECVPGLDKLNGQLPIEKTSGQLPAERISGQLSQWSTSGSAISYPGPVCIGTTNVEATLNVGGPVRIEGGLILSVDPQLLEKIRRAATPALQAMFLSVFTTIELSISIQAEQSQPPKTKDEVIGQLQNTDFKRLRPQFFEKADKPDNDMTTDWSLNDIANVVSQLLKTQILDKGRWGVLPYMDRLTEPIQKINNLSGALTAAYDPAQARIGVAEIAKQSSATAFWLHTLAQSARRSFSNDEREKLLAYVEKANRLAKAPPALAGETWAGRIQSPMWQISQAMVNVAGPLPLTGQFTTGGGTLLLLVSGSGRFDTYAVVIGMEIWIDNIKRGEAKVGTNTRYAHCAFSLPLMVQGLARGSHTVQLIALSNTTTDATDFFNVTVMEFPF